MSSGTWTTQNKVRAGAYINFVGKNSDNWDVGNRNVMTMPVEMDWGAASEIIKLTSSQLLDGSCEKIIGYTAADPESLVFREALSNCSTALIYRLNGSGGEKASYSVYEDSEFLYKIQAKYVGKAGNKISFKVIENEADNTKVDFITYYRNNEKDYQVISRNRSIWKMLSTGELKNNDWIDIVSNQKQPDISFKGWNFKIACSANEETYIGEEGNKLSISFKVETDIEGILKGTIKIYEDDSVVKIVRLPVNKKFDVSDLPENNYVKWSDDCGGTILPTAEEVSITPFNQVIDPRIQLEAGATLENGLNGKSYFPQQASASWGSLKAVSKLENELGNSLSFTIEKEVINGKTKVSHENKLSSPIILTYDRRIVARNIFGTPTRREVATVKITKVDPSSSEKYIWNLDNITREVVIAGFLGAVYEHPWKVNELSLSDDKTTLYIDFTVGSTSAAGKKLSDIGILWLEAPDLIINSKTTAVVESMIMAPLALVEYVDGSTPLVVCKPQTFEEGSTVDTTVTLKIASDHMWNKDSTELTKKSNWAIRSTIGVTSSYIESVQINSENEKEFLIKVKNTVGISINEIDFVYCTDKLLDNAIVTVDGEKVTLSERIDLYALTGREAGVGELYLTGEVLKIPTNTKDHKWEITVQLKNHANYRYAFGDKCEDVENYSLINPDLDYFNITKVELVSVDELKFTIEKVGDDPILPDLSMRFVTLEDKLILDQELKDYIPVQFSEELITTYQEGPPVKDKYNKITIKLEGINVKVLNMLHAEKTIEEFLEEGKLENNYIQFSGNGKLELTMEEVFLKGGHSKSSEYTSENGYFAHIKGEKFNCMCLPQFNVSEVIKRSAVKLIKALRDEQGMKCQVVLENYAGSSCNYEGVISVKQGYKTTIEEIPRHIFCATVAGFTAGAGFNQSNTYKVLEGATDIIYYDGEKPYTNSEYEEQLRQGHFLLSKRRDLTIVCEKDQNTLHSPYPSNNVNYSFTKNRVIRTLDEINNTVVDIWENRFVGKISNNDKGRTMYKTALINYINELERLEAVQNFDPQKDVEVLAGDKIDAVLVNLAITPVDAMEKLYMTVTIN